MFPKCVWTGGYPGQASALLELKAQRRDAEGTEVALPFRVDRRACSGATRKVEAAGLGAPGVSWLHSEQRRVGGSGFLL